jgi:tetratricopeptide (TPR) repeat protein
MIPLKYLSDHFRKHVWVTRIFQQSPARIFPVFLLVLMIALPATAYSAPADSSYSTGLQLTSAGEYSRAVAAFDQAIAQEPAYFEAWNGKADALNRDGQYDLALQASDRTLAIRSSFSQGWINRGYILYNLGRYDEELLAYEKAITLDPDNAEAWFNRGYALAGMGRYDEALRSFDKVAAINTAYPNLEANRRIAEKNRDAATPFYIRYAVWILVAAIVLAYAGVLIYGRRTRKR